MISEGKKVKIHFKLLVDGQEIQSTADDKPFEYTHGQHAIFPAMEKKLEGLNVGDEKKIQLSPDEGFGQPKSELIIEAPRDKFDPSKLQIGAAVSSKSKDGKVHHAHIKGIKDDTVVLDFNHPLAGKTLDFDIQIADIHPA